MTTNELAKIGAQTVWLAACTDLRLLIEESSVNGMRSKPTNDPAVRVSCKEFIDEIEKELNRLRCAYDSYYATPSPNSK